jgi:transposase
MIWLTELIDIRRFKNLDHLSSYVGLVPGEHSSGEKHITTELDHRGNQVLRSLLIENSWAALRKDPALMMKYTELTKRMTGNRAIIRISRKLLNRIRYVLINEKEYEIGKVN